MNNPLVSLLMAAYNNAGYIKVAIDSVRCQSYSNWELIIVDDGSTDGTYELAVAMALRDTRIKVFRNEVNRGYNFTITEAQLRASGELLAHFDSDDLLERWALDEMVNAFRFRESVKLIYSDFAQIGVHGEHQSYSASLNFDPHKLHQHGWRHFGMYRASVLDSISGYNEKLFDVPGCSDGDLFMQIAEVFPYEIMRLPKVLYLYRNHSGNITKSMQKCDTCTHRQVCNYMRVWAKSANYDPITFTPLEKTEESKNE